MQIYRGERRLFETYITEENDTTSTARHILIPGVTSYDELTGSIIPVKAYIDGTSGTTTVQVNSLSSVNLKLYYDNNVPVAPTHNWIFTGQVYYLVYTGTYFTLVDYAKYSNIQRKPVVVWESNDPTTYLKAIQTDISASPAWQLTNLDMTPFKRIKIYSCAGQTTGSTASASTTVAMILEMSLDSRAAISAYGGNYIGSIISQKPNDNNRLATLTCAVSSDKTSFVVLRQTNLYGTAATSNNDVNANVFMIEGYYD